MNNIILNNKYKVYENGEIIKLKTNTLIKQYIHKTKGYIFVSLGSKSVLLHRIIAKAFIPNPDNLPEVNHIDGNKANNAVSNLEWCTAKQNSQHALINGLRNNTTGKSVINILTNKIYTSMFKAWNDSDKEFSYTHFKYMMNGKYENKTNFKYK